MKNLLPLLQQVERDYHRLQFLSSDPLEFVHRFKDPWDQEAMALIAALLAYGKVAQIRKSLEETLLRIYSVSDGPAHFVRQLESARFRKKAHAKFENLAHRFNKGADIVALFHLLNHSWETHGSLGGHFLNYLTPSDPTIEHALNALISEWRSWLKAHGRNVESQPTFSYLLTAPEDGSCCKRWCMLLRWMGRRDALDPGLWMNESPLRATFPTGRHLQSHQLVMPLDTHTGRISCQLGLTSKKSFNWKMALEVTHSLKQLDPTDPIRYDFALARLGILNIWKKDQKLYQKS